MDTDAASGTIAWRSSAALIVFLAAPLFVLGMALATAARAQLYVDVTATHLPPGILDGASMDALAVDVDADGDLDIVVAIEFGPNVLLVNDGTGHFADESGSRIPQVAHDSEDIGAADFDGDGFVDLVIVSEDDQTDELYLNDGTGTFADAGDRLPVLSITNGVAVEDIDGDGRPDIVLANNGQNRILINEGGIFSDDTAHRLPAIDDVTQDVVIGDMDGDGDRDLVFANEGPNRLLLNDGTGVFADRPNAFALAPPDESREASLGDVDGDGDLDVFFANVRAFMPSADPRNRLWINLGGQFADESVERLPPDRESNFHGGFADVDNDGDLDVVTASTTTLRGPGDGPVRTYLNDGSGHFVDGTADVLPTTAVGNGFDVEVADFDGDGFADLYLALRHGTNRLLLYHAMR